MTPDQIRIALQAAIVAAIVAVGFAGGWMVNGWRLGTEVEKKEATIQQLTGELARERDANDSMRASLTNQTISLRQLAEQGQKLAAAAAKAVHAASLRADVLTTQVEELMKRPIPKDPAEDCPALERDLNDAIRGRRAL